MSALNCIESTKKWIISSLKNNEFRQNYNKIIYYLYMYVIQDSSRNFLYHTKFLMKFDSISRGETNN